MGGLENYYTQCRKILCLTAKHRETITYGHLAKKLNLKNPRQQWSSLLNPIAVDETKRTGRDLTLVVVYASGPAKGLGRYFSNIRGGAAAGSSRLDPQDQAQIAAYKRELESVYDAYANENC